MTRKPQINPPGDSDCLYQSGSVINYFPNSLQHYKEKTFQTSALRMVHSLILSPGCMCEIQICAGQQRLFGRDITPMRCIMCTLLTIIRMI